MYAKYVKRPIDILCSLGFLAALLPVFILAACWIKAVSPGPVFFRQERFGRGMRRFEILKFRTMTNNPERRHDRELFFEVANPEMIKGGVFLRRFKIDELPQLLNVLLGDMSLIGPRPQLPEPPENANDDWRARFDAAPGCTGLAQVNGNIYIPWEERWRFDAYYARHVGFALDMKIAFATLHMLAVGESKKAKTFESWTQK